MINTVYLIKVVHPFAYEWFYLMENGNFTNDPMEAKHYYSKRSAMLASKETSYYAHVEAYNKPLKRLPW